MPTQTVIKYDAILSLDPSGSFHEGKGTTGYCLMLADGTIEEINTICARQHTDAFSYFKAHVLLIEQLAMNYENLCVVMEDYVLYANKAASQVNSAMETCQLLGVLKYVCDCSRIPWHIQKAAAVKTRWSDEVLLSKGILKKDKRGLMADGFKICKHEIDAIRHAMHFVTFYNKGE